VKVLRSFWWRKVRRYDSEICQSCERPYFAAIGDTYWSADDALWLWVEGGPGGLRCPPCFTRDCRAKGISIFWRPVIDDERMFACHAFRSASARLKDL
jgi:hypothetical protein